MIIMMRKRSIMKRKRWTSGWFLMAISVRMRLCIMSVVMRRKTMSSLRINQIYLIT
jgi:hypothetical protein